MGWKDLSYSLRGGIIVLALSIVIFPIFLFVTYFISIPFGCSAESFQIICRPKAATYILLLISALTIFVVGAIIGWIYGKIKGR